MSRATGAKKVKKQKPVESMKAGKDREEEHFDPSRKDNIFGRKKTRQATVGGAFQRPIRSLGQSVEVLGEYLLGIAFGWKPLVDSHVNCSGLQLCEHQDFATDVVKCLFCEIRLALLGPGGTACGAPAHSVHLIGTFQEKYGPHGELLFFFIKKGPVAQIELAIALIGLHLSAARGGLVVVNLLSYVDLWRQGCPMCPEWISSCSASETSCGAEEYGHNNECRAIEVIGQDWSSEVVALFLQDWELDREWPSAAIWQWTFSAQEMRDACWVSSESLDSPLFTVITVPERFSCEPSQQQKPFSHRGRAVTIDERDAVREVKGEGT